MNRNALSLLLLIAALIQPALSSAGPSEELVRGNVYQYGVPYWKQQANGITEIRKRVRDPFYIDLLAELDAGSANGTIPALLAKQPGASDARELDAKMLWLRWNVLTQNADGRYAYIYAFNLSRTKNRDNNESLIRTAATFYLLGRLSLQVDGARCEDKASPQAALMRYEREPGMAAIGEYFLKMTGAARAEALMHAAAIEEMRGERKPQAWLCRLGAQSMLQAMQENSNITIAPAEGTPAGAAVQVDTSSVEPRFISESQWRKERKDLIDRTISSAASAVNAR